MLKVMNIAQALTNAARLWPERTGFVEGPRQWSWSELNKRVNALSGALENLGVRKGDRVMVQARNSHCLYESLYAIVKLGAVYLPTNARASAEETAFMAEHSRAKAMIVQRGLAENVRAAAQCSANLEHVIWMEGGESQGLTSVRESEFEALIVRHWEAGERVAPVTYDDPFYMVYTSGTTGRPKGLPLSHGHMTYVLNNRLADILPGLGPDDALLAIAPLTHGTGTVAICCTMRGAKIVLTVASSFDEEECWQLIEQQRITTTFTVPTILMRLIRHASSDKFDRSSLRRVIYAGSPISREDQALAIQKLGKILVQYYGSSENMGCGTVLRPEMHGDDPNDPLLAPLGSCGVARTGALVAILDESGDEVSDGEVGEICAAGPGVFDEYFEDPQASANVFRNGWLRTGDLGRRDERGFFYVVGRAVEMYISGGFNVYPSETEQCLRRHPAVEDAVVVGVPDSTWGEVGLAVVMLKSGQVANEAQLKVHVRTALAGYKNPKRIIIWESIPTGTYGKRSKRELMRTLIERGIIVPGTDLA